ncbi:MAG: DUF885 family protein, partial [Rhodospirillaceae bacterium]|nr:DUF885 family protein [Rhodospirillaceae bacterium]
RDLAELAAIARDALGPVDRIAYDVFDYRTRQTIELFDTGLFDVQRKAPLNPSFGLQVEFPDFVSSGAAPFADIGDYDDGLKRLDGFAGYLENTVAWLKRGLADGYVQPRIVVTNILAQVDAMLALPIDDSPFTNDLFMPC